LRGINFSSRNNHIAGRFHCVFARVHEHDASLQRRVTEFALQALLNGFLGLRTRWECLHRLELPNVWQENERVNPKAFFGELKRRNVYRVAIAYGVVAWLLIQIATQVSPFFEIPNWAVRLVVLLLMIGFPVALILAWAFELTPEGIKRTEEVAPNESIRHRTGRKIVAVTVMLAVIAAAILAFRLSRQEPPAARKPASSTLAEAPPIPEKSIAVLRSRI
jgi:hypothetical protein